MKVSDSDNQNSRWMMFAQFAKIVWWWMEYWPQVLNCYVLGWGCLVGLLKLYWTDDQIDRIEKTLETFLKRDEKDVLFLRCLKFVRRQTQVCGDFSSKAQMEYLHGGNLEI